MLCRVLLLIFSIIVIHNISTYETSSLSPIIFIPGSFCSLIEVRINTTIQTSCSKSFHNQWILLWLNLHLFELDNLICFHNVLQFKYNSSTNIFENPPGVETRIISKSINSSFLNGLLWEYVQLDVFYLHYIKKYNYTDGLNLHSMTYDFRRGNNQTLYQFSNDLKLLIESIYVKNFEKRVYLVSHSTGGSMTLYFLAQQTQSWKDRYVNGWISLSGNLAGEVDNMQNLIQGFLTPAIPAHIIKTWDFFAWRLPEPIAYNSKRQLIRTEIKNYTSYDMFSFLNDIDGIELAQIYNQTSSILATLPAPNVNTYCFYGVNVSTPIAYVSKTKKFENDKLDVIYGWGDGEQDDTTNMSCQLWKDTMDRQYIFLSKGFNHVSHLELVGNEQVLESIDQTIISSYMSKGGLTKDCLD